MKSLISWAEMWVLIYPMPRRAVVTCREPIHCASLGAWCLAWTECVVKINPPNANLWNSGQIFIQLMSWAVCSSLTIIKDKPELKVSSSHDITSRRRSDGPALNSGQYKSALMCYLSFLESCMKSRKGSRCSFGCFFLLACGDACWVNKLNVRVAGCLSKLI